jgi:ribonuclease BN (tRNA processing enzyme)
MKVVFLGVGEACDERLPNTSIWVQTEVHGNRRSVLLDCGFTVPPLVWAQEENQNDLDALWISHFHGDHFFGVPALLLRMWERKREKPLAIIGQAGTDSLVYQAMDLAYPNFMRKLMYPLQFITAVPEEEVNVAGLNYHFAENGHGQKDLAVRIDDGQRSVFYSGDGLPTVSTVALARGCDLVIHEAFRVDQPTPGHGTIRECIDFAREARAPSLALVHLQRDERRDRYNEIMRILDQVGDLHALLPEPGDVLEL